MESTSLQEGKIPSRPRSIRSALSQGTFGQYQSKCEAIAVYNAFSTILHHHSPDAVSQLLSSEPFLRMQSLLRFYHALLAFSATRYCPQAAFVSNIIQDKAIPHTSNLAVSQRCSIFLFASLRHITSS